MMRSLKHLVEILPSEERPKSLYLIFMLIVMAVLEVIGIGSIMPFLAVISNPQIIHENKWLAWAYSTLGFADTRRFLFVTGFFTLGIFLVKNGFNAWVVWVQYRFAYRNNYKLAVKLTRAYFSMPYDFFLDTNTSNHRKNILSEVNNVIAKFLIPLIALIAQALVALFIVALIVLVDPLLALMVTLILGVPYLIIYQLLKRTITTLGLKRLDANKFRYKALDQSFGGIKDVKILGKEAYFQKEFSKHQKILTDSVGKMHFFNEIPRFIVESLAIGGLLTILLYMLGRDQSMQQIIPVFGLYAVSARRLMPALRSVVSSMNSLRANQPALELLYGDFKGKEEYLEDSAKRRSGTRKLTLEKELELSDLSFSYSSQKDEVIHHIDLKIAANSAVALVGPSGGGKTTLADIIMGLLEPKTGCMQVDGKKIDAGNIAQWRQNIGYVPQQIYLNDDTVTRNVAYGIPDAEIDFERVKKATRLAAIYDFVVNELPEGFETAIGEKGIRLSGGQRQRIGLARALYNNPDVLILDEATSSLDGITEASISKALNQLAGKKTLIIIAHRITTVKRCDMIYFIDKGRIIDRGTYDELMNKSTQFQAMSR